MKCNNCDVQQPVEQLRIPVSTFRGDMRLIYPGRREEPETFMDMLLCDPCKILYRDWNLRYETHKGRHGVYGHYDGSLKP